MAKRKKKPAVTIAQPTPEQLDKGVFTVGGIVGQRAAFTYRRIPVIDTMAQTGKLSPRQHFALARYRDVAIAEERSPMRDSLDKAMQGPKGQGDGTGHIRTAYELNRLESTLGPLIDVARAIAVDDTTVSQFACNRGGTNADGSPKRKWLQLCMRAIQVAGDRLAVSVGA
jgi:hypothetical protein